MTASHFDPVFDHTTKNNADLIDEIKELADVIGDGGDVRVGPLQVLLVYLANALHALIHLPSICNNQDTIGYDIWSWTHLQVGPIGPISQLLPKISFWGLPYKKKVVIMFYSMVFAFW